MNNTNEFTVHHLRFEVEVLTPLLLPAHAGPSIRGALFGALRHHFCPAVGSPSVEHKALCPVCWLMATEKPGHDRGRDIPRPYAVEPPIPVNGHDRRAMCFDPGERFTFDLTLFAQALKLFPYLVVAMPIMGQAGLGVPLKENASQPGHERRGQFVLRRIEAINPLSGESASVKTEEDSTVQVPDLPVRDQDVTATNQAMLEQLNADGQVQLDFRTPTRIVEAGRLTRRPWLGPLFRRLLERLDALRSAYADLAPVTEREHLTALADQVRLTQDETHWMEVKSGSRRQGHPTWVSGFVGRAVYQADPDLWREILPYLLWGQEVHVGKNTTKGNGWYELQIKNGE